MRSKTNAILVVLGLVGCAGADVGSSTTQSPFYGPGGEAGGDDDAEADDTDADSGTEDDGAGPIPGDPDPSDPNATDPAPDDPTDDPTDADDGGAPQPPPQPPAGGDCCTPAGAPGCANDPNVEMCVCQIDDFCCTQQWDETCVSIVGECAEPCPGAEPPPDDGGTGGTDGGAMGGDCCAPTGAPGCADPQIADCVCQIDDYCCTVEWDDVCAGIATECGC